MGLRRQGRQALHSWHAGGLRSVVGERRRGLQRPARRADARQRFVLLAVLNGTPAAGERRPGVGQRSWQVRAGESWPTPAGRRRPAQHACSPPAPVRPGSPSPRPRPAGMTAAHSTPRPETTCASYLPNNPPGPPPLTPSPPSPLRAREARCSVPQALHSVLDAQLGHLLRIGMLGADQALHVLGLQVWHRRLLGLPRLHAQGLHKGRWDETGARSAGRRGPGRTHGPVPSRGARPRGPAPL